MTVRKELPFDQVKTALMQDLLGHLEQWFPNGKRRGREYLIGNLRGDAGESLSINLDTGEWQDFGDLSEPKGKDALGLYAMAFCGGGHKAGRTAACKELAGKLGIEGGTPAQSGAKVVKLNPKAKKADDWKPIWPLPDGGVRPPDMAGKNYEHIHTYRDGSGVAVRYVGRYTKRDGGKGFAPWSYGTLNGLTGWHPKHPGTPMCLFGLDTRAARPSARVLIQEGELKTERVGGLLDDAAWCCMAWSGGHTRVMDHDWTPVAGADVVLCGDNDAVGRRAVQRLADHLRRLGCTVTVIDLTGMAEGWDLGDAVRSGWDAARIEGFLKDRARERLDDPESGDDLDADDVEPDGAGPDEKDARKKPPIPLGYENGIYYYLSPLTRQIEALSRRQHTKNDLIGIASLRWYEGVEKFRNEKGGISWDAVGDFLKNKCSEAGFFNPDRVRGRGAWLDEGRAVLHVGDRLLVRGQTNPLLLSGSPFIYEAARSLNYALAEPLDRSTSKELLKICKLFRWEKKVSATLMAGWVMVAPICGALFWRPSIWVSGGSGSGKSTLEKLVVRPTLGGIGLFLKGGTTEAGVRQYLNRDARPVVFDEAEAESPQAKIRIQSILELVRQSSSEGGAEIIKGTQSQTGAKRYHVRSCFMFSSINVTLDHLADESRVTVLELLNPPAGSRAHYDAMVERINAIITPEFCAGLVARAVRLMPTIIKNAETFSRAVSVHLGNSRVGDQIGTLLAGAYALRHDDEISAADALDYVRAEEWDDATSATATADESRLLGHLMQTRVRLDVGSKTEDLSLDEIVKMAAGANGDALASFAQAELRRHGMAWDGTRGGVWVSNSHTALKEHLSGTPWASQWARTLRRLPGAEALPRDAAAISFTGSRDRATFLPLNLIE